MCLLCVFEPNVTPTRQQLMNAARQNPHGYGYAFLTEDRILTGRGMDADEVIDRFLRIREGFPNTYAMFHARYTTHGSTNKSNCHPFRVGGDPNIVLGHNGILPVDVPKGDDRSDTRLFAEDILPEFIEWLDDPDGFDQLEDWAGGSKLAIFSLDPRLKHGVYIVNEQLGHWDNGAWWSNHSYKGYSFSSPSSSYYRSHYKKWWDDEDDTPAESCGSEMTLWWKRQSDQSCIYCGSSLGDDEWEYGFCDNCKSCLECAQDIIDCECLRTADFKPRQYKRWWEEEAFADEGIREALRVDKSSHTRQVVQSLVPYTGGWATE